MYSLKLLGGLSLGGPGGPIAGRAARPRLLAVLARLAVTPTGVTSRDTLAACFWPDKPESQARHLLADAVYLLRSELGEGTIVSAGNDLRLDPRAVHTDVQAFERALAEGDRERAVDLYKGPFLDGFLLSHAAGFERWADTEGGRLARCFAGALEQLAKEAEASGDEVACVAWWEKRAALDPLDSRVARSLMSAYSAAGNAAKALRHGEAHEDLVRQELGLEPGAEYRSLVDDLRHQLDSATPTRERSVGLPEALGEAARAGAPSRGTGAVRPDRVRLEPAPAEQPEPSSHSRPAHDAGRKRSRWRTFGAVAAVVAMSGLATIAYLLGRPLAPAGRDEAVTVDLASPTRPAIAVLPFENLSHLPSDSAFVRGFHRSLISQLSKISALRVTPAKSVREYLENRPPGSRIGTDLDVDFLLDGGIQRSGGALQMEVQLGDRRRELVVWTQDYSRELTAENLFDVQRELAEWITREIGVELLQAEAASLAKRPTDDLEAWDYFTLGWDYAPRSGPQMRAIAASHFERAIERDPKFALALAHLSMVHSDAFSWGDDRSTERIELARRMADSALALAPDLPEARLARGLYEYRGRQDYAAAIRWLTRALEVGPRDVIVLNLLGNVQRRVGDFRNALVTHEEALLADRRSADVHLDLAYDYIHAHRYEDAARTVEEGMALTPDQFATEGPQKLAWIELLAGGGRERVRAALRPLFDQAEQGNHRGLGNFLYYSRPGTVTMAAVVRALEEGDLRKVYESEPDTNPVRRSRAPALRYWAQAQLADLDGKETLRLDFLDSARVTLRHSIDSLQAEEASETENRRRLSQDYRLLALVLAELGQRDEAVQAAEAAVDVAQAGVYAFFDAPFALAVHAQVRTMFGEHEEAVDLLESIVPAPSWFSAPLLRLDPLWDPLEGHPRFEAMLGRISASTGAS